MSTADIIERGTAAEQNALITRCKAGFTIENPAFMWAVVSYRKLAKKLPTGNLPIAVVQIGGMIPFEYRGGANIMGKWLYDKYIAESSATQVNLPATMVTKLARLAGMHGTPFTPPDYDEAYEAIGKLMDLDVATRR